MPNITVSVPDEMKLSLEAHPNINWSEEARRAFASKLEELSKEEQKGETVQKLEEALRPVKSNREMEIQTKKQNETSRFVRKWGKPEASSGFATEQEPYIYLSKYINIPLSKGMASRMKIVNQKNVEKTYSSSWKISDSKNWSPEMNDLMQAFKSIGFKVNERELGGEELGLFLYPEGTTSQRREFVRNFRGTAYGLFAFDEEDMIYLGNRNKN
ncbi:MAG: hypothetical protein JRN52_14025 [Nitrososphaerota archaeon]|nr:hypothetical protein [Nitrososphaerota archaeon]